MANKLYQGILSLAILASLFIWIYSSLKKQSIKDTILELKEIWTEAITNE